MNEWIQCALESDIRPSFKEAEYALFYLPNYHDNDRKDVLFIFKVWNYSYN